MAAPPASPQTPGQGSGQTVLSVEDMAKIITDVKSATTDPLSVAMQISSALGDNVSVSGSVLQQALTACAVPLQGPLADMVNAIQEVTKSADLVCLTIAREVQIVLSGTRVRLNTAVCFKSAETDSLPALNNISGVSVHKFFWIAIQTIQLIENQGQKMVRVVTPIGKAEFPVA
jgi:hypothetical protein